MDTERWQRLSPLLDELLELEPDERAQRLHALREDDAAMAAELETLLALEDGQEDFLAEPLVAPMAGTRPGSAIGPYRLERLIGEGGMGQVWLAARADGLYQRRVALKLLRPGLADSSLRLRFSRERQILARLAHPHIARLLDAGVSGDGLPYLALEYVDGEPITDVCRHRNVPVAARLRMFRQICDAVSHAHANLIVHRDLKPSNILVTPAGDVRLLDFGIAKLLDGELPVVEQTRTGVRTFTLHYAAPEQIRGEPVTTMTDVYSLGVVLYELLTDLKPYRLKRQTDAEWEEAILVADPMRPSQAVLRPDEATGTDRSAQRRRSRWLAGDLDNIVLKTLSKRPEQRYPSVEALALDLQRFEAGRPVQARAQSWTYRTQKYLRRHRWALASGTLVTAVLASALAIVGWQAREAVAEASRAQAMQDFLAGLFEQAGTASQDGQPLDLRGLLDASVERGNRELARQPRARAELLGVVARIRTGLGDYRQAQALLDRQAAILAATDDVPPSLLLESLAQRGQVLARLGDPRACIDLMRPSLDLARREQAQLPLQASEFYSQLGRCHRGNGERAVARQLFERALEQQRDLGDAPVGEVESLIDLADLRRDADDLAAARQGYEAARAQLRTEASDRHPLLVDIGRKLGDLQRAVGQHAAAERELRDALAMAIELHGAAHPDTLALRRELAGALSDQGRHGEAALMLREAQRELVARSDGRTAGLQAGYVLLARAEWELGNLGAALAAQDNALALARRGGDDGEVADALHALAQLRLANGEPGSAEPLLGQARALRAQRYGADHPLVGDT
ncbi:MAG: protein kinase, partial [Pseudomonas sp.]|nr:protein kinase [Pseudomonas sp.]